MSKHIGERMNGAKIDEFLQEEGLGALGLASGGEAYAVPIAFAFDERLWTYETQWYEREVEEKGARAVSRGLIGTPRPNAARFFRGAEPRSAAMATRTEHVATRNRSWA